jgi:hypothetical protein
LNELPADRVSNHPLVDIVAVAEALDERGDVLLSEHRDEIDIEGRTGNPMRGARDRTDVVINAQVFEGLDHGGRRRDDLVGVHARRASSARSRSARASP